MKLVSVIMPAFNAQKYIKDAIESVLNQKYQNFELIVINDGSTDKTLDVINFYKSNEKIKILTQSNQGQCSATNFGLRHATGDYIQFLDADDALDSMKLANQVEFQLKYGSDVVTYSNWHNYSSQVSIPNNFKIHTKTKPIEWLETLFCEGEMLANSCYLIPRHIIGLAGDYDTDLTVNNDLEYFTRVVLCSSQILYCNTAFTYYRRDIENSLSKTNSFESFQNEFLAKKKTVDFLLAKSKSPSTLNAVSFLLNGLIIRTSASHFEFSKEIIKFHKSIGIIKYNYSKMKILNYIVNAVGVANFLQVKNLLRKILKG